MKLIWPFLLLFPLFVACNGTETPEDIVSNEKEVDYCDCNELAFDQPYNNFYLEEARKGFTGLCEIFYANGNLSLSKHFTKGKVDGEMNQYFEDGTLMEQKFFDMNFQTGDHFRYDQQGELIFHVVYDYGKQIKTIYVN